VPQLEKLIRARKELAYGKQRDYFDHPNCIGWTRAGDEEHPGSGCALVLSNGEKGDKRMEIGQHHAGKQFTDLLGNCQHTVTVDKDGWATFNCEAGSVSVWGSK
jgi:alpha-amylase